MNDVSTRVSLSPSGQLRREQILERTILAARRLPMARRRHRFALVAVAATLALIVGASSLLQPKPSTATHLPEGTDLESASVGTRASLVEVELIPATSPHMNRYLVPSGGAWGNERLMTDDELLSQVAQIWPNSGVGLAGDRVWRGSDDDPTVLISL